MTTLITRLRELSDSSHSQSWVSVEIHELRALLDVVEAVEVLIISHYIDATCKNCTGEVNHVEQLLEKFKLLEVSALDGETK